jgi:dienelactone hydrolase
MVSVGPSEEVPAADEWLSRPVDNRTFQAYLVFLSYDRRVPFDVRVLDVKEEGGIRKEHVSFQSTPGVRVFAHLYRPVVSVSPKDPAVILLHGGVSSGKDSKAIEMLATLQARAGWKVLAIDMQYFGERSTDLLKTYTEQEKHERLYNRPATYLAWVTQTVKDVSRSFDFLVEQRNADPKRIGLVGFSRGAQAGAIAGGAERRLAAVALLHGGHFDRLERGHLPAACPANYIGRISPRPLLMINGNHDTDYLKDTSVLPLFRLANPPKLILWRDTRHGVLTEEDRSAMLQWLKANLK